MGIGLGLAALAAAGVGSSLLNRRNQQRNTEHTESQTRGQRYRSDILAKSQGVGISTLAPILTEAVKGDGFKKRQNRQPLDTPEFAQSRDFLSRMKADRLKNIRTDPFLPAGTRMRAADEAQAQEFTAIGNLLSGLNQKELDRRDKELDRRDAEKQQNIQNLFGLLNLQTESVAPSQRTPSTLSTIGSSLLGTVQQVGGPLLSGLGARAGRNIGNNLIPGPTTPVESGSGAPGY